MDNIIMSKKQLTAEVIALKAELNECKEQIKELGGHEHKRSKNDENQSKQWSPGERDEKGNIFQYYEKNGVPVWEILQ